MSAVRTRNAPSPTGVPHIGNSRTALWDYLLARKYHGQFILRLEDTDQKRFIKGSPEKIYQIHQFLNLIPDEDYIRGGSYGPYIQTKRLSLYQKYAQKLIDKGAAYQQDGAVRVRLPRTGYTIWKDLVQGKISIANKEVDNKVLLKSNGIPTYHLAVVVDDHLMKISHVLRGTEWIVSTPVHLYLYQVLGWQPPVFAHVPLLLGPDKSKLSKRHGAKSVLEFRDQGYLSPAILNFLFYLGFSYQDNSKLLTLEQMIKIFDETKIQKQNAVFDIDKLNYFNSRWIKQFSVQQLFKSAQPFLPSDWLVNKAKLFKILNLLKGRLTTLKEIKDQANFFFISPQLNSTQILKQSEHSSAFTSKWLKTVIAILDSLSNFTSDHVHQQLKQVQSNSGLSPRQAFMTLRLALTGQEVTPPLFDTISILGKRESLSRLQRAIKLLS